MVLWQDLLEDKKISPYTESKELTANHIAADDDYRYIIDFNSPTDVTLILDESVLTAFPEDGIFELIARKTGAGNIGIIVNSGSTLDAPGTSLEDPYKAVYFGYVGNNKWIGIGELV